MTMLVIWLGSSSARTVVLIKARGAFAFYALPEFD
jgi:hypothetical protein